MIFNASQAKGRVCLDGSMGKLDVGWVDEKEEKAEKVEMRRVREDEQLRSLVWPIELV